MMKDNAMLYAQIALMPVSKGDGFGSLSWTSRKKASWRDSTERIEEINLATEGSERARRWDNPMVAEIPTEPMRSATSKNSFAEETGNE